MSKIAQKPVAIILYNIMLQVCKILKDKILYTYFVNDNNAFILENGMLPV